MNISKFTQKSIEAVNNLEKVAYQFGHQEIEEEHLLYSLLHQEDSLIAKLIEKMEIQKEYFEDRLDNIVHIHMNQNITRKQLSLNCLFRHYQSYALAS